MRNKQHNQNQHLNKIYITKGEPYKGKIIILSNKALSINLNALPVPTLRKVALNDTEVAPECHQEKVTLNGSDVTAEIMSVSVGKMSAVLDSLPGKEFHWFFTSFSPKNRTSPFIAHYTREPLNLICRQVPFMFCVAGGLL